MTRPHYWVPYVTVWPTSVTPWPWRWVVPPRRQSWWPSWLRSPHSSKPPARRCAQTPVVCNRRNSAWWVNLQGETQNIVNLLQNTAPFTLRLVPACDHIANKKTHSQEWPPCDQSNLSKWSLTSLWSLWSQGFFLVQQLQPPRDLNVQEGVANHWEPLWNFVTNAFFVCG